MASLSVKFPVIFSSFSPALVSYIGNPEKFYFGGFDPNSYTSTNMAWIYKKDYQITAVDEIHAQENSFILYPNPASNQLFIESEILESSEFIIINMLGKKVAYGRINGKIKLVDISSLPPNVYILRVANETFKFIKTN